MEVRMLIHDDDGQPRQKQFSRATPKQYGWRLLFLGVFIFAITAAFRLPEIFIYPAFAAVCIGFALILGEPRKRRPGAD
jgi:hypothetical protein